MNHYHCYHTINGLENLKGGSAIQQQGQQKQQQIQQQKLLFPQNEISLISKSLELCRFYVTKNSQLFQQPEDILEKVNQALSIISSSSKSNNNNSKNQEEEQSSYKTKVASDNRYQNLVNIRNMFGLNIKENRKNIQLKGASKSSKSNNNNICSKKQSLINLRSQFNLNQ